MYSIFIYIIHVYNVTLALWFQINYKDVEKIVNIILLVILYI